MKRDKIARTLALQSNSELEEMTNQGQIKGQVILTQAEYDALPSSKTTDGIVYLIVEG